MKACAQGISGDREVVAGAARASQALTAEMRGALAAVQMDGDGSPMKDLVLVRGRLPPIRRADLLASQMLAYTGAQSLAPVQLDLLPFLSDLAYRLLQTLDMRIRVFVNVGHDCPPCHVDVHALQEALLNLVINARDAMPDGGRIQLSAMAAVAADGSPAVAVSVADDSAGMTADFAHRAVLPFVTTKTNDSQAGMGLAATDGFARQSGGCLKISRSTGGGVTATLILPQATPEAKR